MSIDKLEQYKSLTKQLDSLLSNEDNLIANLSNTSAVLNEFLDQINWVGFYLSQGDVLKLGPFQGKVACTTIPIGKGVCGTAAKELTVQRVADVHQFAGHIACDAASNSEIVLPLVVNGELFGVLDIDSPELARFDEIDEQGLTLVADCLVKHLAKAG